MKCAPIYIALIIAVTAPFLAFAAQNPVVIIPPLGGSRLTAVWNKPATVEPYCTKKQTDPFDLYFSNEIIVDGVNKCWRDNFRNVYDPATATFQSVPGVVVTPVAGLAGVNCLTKVFGYCPPAAGDAHALIDALETTAGYTAGIDLFAATYDFRLIADDAHLAEYFASLKGTVERAVAANDGLPAHLVCHSLGCPVAASFLNTAAGIDAAWKRAHVKTYFSLSGAYAGSPSALRSALSGDNEGVASVPNAFFVPISARQGGTLWMFPDPSVLLVPGTPPVVRWTDASTGASTNYTASVADQSALLTRNGYPDSAHAIEHVISRRWKEVYGAPNVTAHLLYGSQLPTELWYEYRSASPGAPIAGNDPAVAYCEDPSAPAGYRSCAGLKPESLPAETGDGTVLHRSLHAVDGWAAPGAQASPVYQLSFPGVAHADMIKNAATVSYVVQHVLASNKGQPYDAARVTRRAAALAAAAARNATK